jgi:hypothetical protein
MEKIEDLSEKLVNKTVKQIKVWIVENNK